MMQVQNILEIVQQLERAGMAVWLDGGWGVDALVGQQTRPHDDIDVVIFLDQAPLAEETLRSSGYVVTEDELPTRFVMCDSQERSIDFHPVTFDQQGDGLQQLPSGTDFHYHCLDKFTSILHSYIIISNHRLLAMGNFPCRLVFIVRPRNPKDILAFLSSNIALSL